MKSLSESLFDADLAKKDITFGDLFELTYSSGEQYYDLNPHPNWTLDNLYNYKLIARDARVTGTPGEIVLKGLQKLVMGLPIKAEMTNKELNAMLKPFEKYYKSLVKNTRRLNCRALPYAYNNKPTKDGDFKSYSDAINNWTLFNVEEIKITFCDVEFIFKKR